MNPANLGSFYVPWSAALAASASLPAPPLQPFTVVLDGVQIPLLTCALGAIGVLAARPLARKKERTLGLGNFLLVSLILLIAIELWIIQSRPDWLFAFVVAVGLGFTGYSLIELVGEEVRDAIAGKLKRIASLTSLGGKSD